MNATVTLSLPEEQLSLLESVQAMMQHQLASQNSRQWLTETEAAERLKVSRSTLRRWKDEGWLRYFAEGSNIRYRADYLDADFEAKTLVKATLQAIQPLRKAS